MHAPPGPFWPGMAINCTCHDGLTGVTGANSTAVIAALDGWTLRDPGFFCANGKHFRGHASLWFRLGGFPRGHSLLLDVFFIKQVDFGIFVVFLDSLFSFSLSRGAAGGERRGRLERERRLRGEHRD